MTKVGERLPNGAILLDETDFKREDGIIWSIVLAMNPGAVEPFVTRMRTRISKSFDQGTCSNGHYFRRAINAFREYEECCEFHTHTEANKKKIIERATADAKAAASWAFDGNTSAYAYERVLNGIEGGDPAVLDELPSPRLSGEYADDPTWTDILKDELWKYDEDKVVTSEYDDLLKLYEDTFGEKVVDFIARTAQEHLGIKA